MKFLHLADLHFGRRLYDVSLLEDQQFVLQQILDQLDARGADAVILAGDVYDKAVPSAEAVRLLDWFLTKLADRSLPVLMVSGNHDSAERLAFGARLLNREGIHISPVFSGAAEPVRFSDAHGEVCVWLLPFVKPIHVRHAYPEQEILTYTDAVETVVKSWNMDANGRNVLVAHQLVTGGQRSESETISIGGLDDVSGAVFADFDYVALGHLHRGQNIGSNLRYAGTPLAYSFSEGDWEKTLTWVELHEKGSVTITETPIRPLHPVRTVKGHFADILKASSEDYLRIILTDEDDVPNALSRLRWRYPNLLRLEYDNLRTRASHDLEPLEVRHLSPLQLLEDFYRLRNDRPMSEEQLALAKAWMEEIWEEEP